MVKIFYDMFIRFDRIHECDGHTDRQTPHDDIGRICIASCGKNDFDEAVHQTWVAAQRHYVHPLSARRMKQFIKPEWLHKGFMSTHLVHDGLSPAVDLIPTPS